MKKGQKKPPALLCGRRWQKTKSRQGFERGRKAREITPRRGCPKGDKMDKWRSAPINALRAINFIYFIATKQLFYLAVRKKNRPPMRAGGGVRCSSVLSSPFIVLVSCKLWVVI
jgi:hypothetical protein